VLYCFCVNCTNSAVKVAAAPEFLTPEFIAKNLPMTFAHHTT
jgi:hypothetical protein